MKNGKLIFEVKRSNIVQTLTSQGRLNMNTNRVVLEVFPQTIAMTVNANDKLEKENVAISRSETSMMQRYKSTSKRFSFPLPTKKAIKV